MSWQVCPLCEGRGHVLRSIVHSAAGNAAEICTVCSGMKIIHTVSGKPPVESKMVKDVRDRKDEK